MCCFLNVTHTDPGTELPPGMGFPQGHQAYFGGVPGVGLPTGSAGNLPTLGYPAVLGNSPGTVGNVFIPPELGGMLQNLTVRHHNNKKIAYTITGYIVTIVYSR